MHMRTKLISLCLFIAFLSGMLLYTHADADTPTQYNAESIYERTETAIFYLRALRSDGSLRAVGTGVVISTEGTAATAYHVVKGADKLEAVFEDGRTVSGITVLGYDELTDAAVLKLPAPQAAAGKGSVRYGALPVREPALKFGEKLFAIGYPFKNTPVITEGIVNNPKAEINGRDRILASTQIASGMSGGPVIDSQGRLAGIISGSLRTVNNMHLVIDMDDLREVLKLETSNK